MSGEWLGGAVALAGERERGWGKTVKLTKIVLEGLPFFSLHGSFLFSYAEPFDSPTTSSLGGRVEVTPCSSGCVSPRILRQ